MDNATIFLCTVVQLSFEDGYLTLVYSIQTVVCLALIPPAIVLGIAIGKTTVLHRNVRICLVNLAISTAINNAGTVVIAGYHLTAVCGSGDKFCDRVALTDSDCVKLQATRNFGALLTLGGLFFLALERICATVQFRTYEKRGSRTIGIGLAVVQWLVSTSALIGMLRAPKKYDGKEMRYPYCNGVAISPHRSCIFFYVTLAAQIFGLFAFIALAVVNKRKMSHYNFNHALRLLSVRYQLKENVKTTKFMIPVSASSCLVFGLTLAALSIFAHQLPQEDGQPLTESTALQQIHFARIMEVVSLSTPAFTAAFIAVVLCCNSHIRHNVKTMFGRVKLPRRASKIGDETQETKLAKDRYFDALKKQWEIPPVK